MKKIQLGGHKKGSKIRGYAIVDDEDFKWLSKWKWHCWKKRTKEYARKTGEISMHRLIMDTPKGMDTDHINGNGLDNRRSNLRICTNQQNQMNRKLAKNNTSGYKGTSWSKSVKKWKASLRYNQKDLFLGYYLNKIEAARIYNQKAIELFGKYARLNKIEIINIKEITDKIIKDL